MGSPGDLLVEQRGYSRTVFAVLLSYFVRRHEILGFCVSAPVVLKPSFGSSKKQSSAYCAYHARELFMRAKVTIASSSLEKYIIL